MNPRLRLFLVSFAAALIAVWMGLQIADESFFWPGFVAMIAIAAILARVLQLPFDVILLGLVVFGYLAGNRGFAQLTPSPGLPLFPAEAALLLALGWRTILWTFARRFPLKRDRLSLVLAAWLVIGGGRLILDLPRYGLAAARDSATVYYALFFFLVQQMATDPRARTWLLRCVVAGLLVMPVTFSLSQFFPGFFFQTLTWNSAPLIFFKGDLAFTFLAVAAVLVFHHATGHWRPWGWILAAGFALAVANSNSRSSMVGLAAAAALLLVARRWRFPAWLVLAVGLAGAGVAGLAIVGNNGWAQRKLHNVADRVVSMVDFHGGGRYESEDSFNKGDNNRFRAVWWHKVMMETWETDPVIGLGFGADLAAGFLQEYYPTGVGDDFSARSPHNIFLTVFGRLGFVGLAVWLAFCVVLLARTWRAMRRRENPTEWALWCSLWVILVSGTFGVVLEGPMGALPFWVMLGLADSLAGEADPVPVAPPTLP